jgi:hypothetical protein
MIQELVVRLVGETPLCLQANAGERGSQRAVRTDLWRYRRLQPHIRGRRQDRHDRPPGQPAGVILPLKTRSIVPIGSPTGPYGYESGNVAEAVARAALGHSDGLGAS